LGLFDRLFQKRKKDERLVDIRLGRYSDAYKEADRYDLWDEALSLFDQQDYLDAYERFLEYLLDPAEQNIHYERSDNLLTFEIIQGSKKLIGHSDGQKIRVQANIAKINTASEPLLRYLLEYNYNLRYCRFGLTEDSHIAIIFDTTTIDGSPYKLYYALKEAASHADKSDDLLIHAYSNVEHTEHALFHHISDELKAVKYTYLIEEIHKVLDMVRAYEVKPEGSSGGVVYTLLSLAYKLDYLIKPEGYIMDRLEEINSIYFSNEITAVGDKIQKIIAEYRAILNEDRTTILSEMYWTQSTFGITAPVNHDRIVNFIDGELANMDWYLENDAVGFVQNIPEYIIGYALFHFAPPKPDLLFLQLYWRIMEQDYFNRLGFRYVYITPDGRLNKKEIKYAIQDIVDANHGKYPNLDPAISSLKYGSRISFAQSYLRMIQQLDMTSKT